jgi:hypothetical protein
VSVGIILDSVTAGAAVAAVLIALWTARRSLEEQRLLAQRSVEEQRRLAHQQFLWEARSSLYSRILNFLHARIAAVEQLSERIEAHQHQAALSDIDRSSADVAAAINDLRREIGLPPRVAPTDVGAAGVQRAEGVEAEPVARMDLVDILGGFTELLTLPPDLQVETDLLASEKATEALGEYTARIALPHLVADDVDAWSNALEVSMSALDRLTEALARELELDPSGSN